jgi:phage major head subunit gpT-like protein
MQQFLDEPVDQTINEKKYVLADSIWKGNLAVQRKTLEDDQYGLLMMRARELGQEPVRHWNELIYTTLATGFSNLCYDGLYYFSASHQEGASPVQSNLGAGVNLSDAALEAAHGLMTSLVDDKGKPFHARPDTLVVGPALERRAWNLVGQPVVYAPVGSGTAGTGATASTAYANFFYGKYKLVVSPYLIGAAAYYWFLMDTKREIKPIVMQNREDVPITLETDMDQPTQKIKEVYHFTARGRYVPGYGLWQLCYGASGTA